MISGWIDLSDGIANSLSEGAIAESWKADGPGRRSLSLPGIAVAADGDSVACGHRNSVIAIAVGAPVFSDAHLEQLAQREGIPSAWLRLYEEHQERAPTFVGGVYSVVVLDPVRRKVLLAVDRFSIRSLCYAVKGSRLAFSDRADGVPLEARHSIDAQAIFDYLYFHVIPAPRTVFAGVNRLPGGYAALFDGELLTVRPYWVPLFEEVEPRPLRELASEFRTLIRNAVLAEAKGANVGCFLSGGTDSSTVAGMLRDISGARPKTFSIGFDARGYDEMHYARIAARHFDTEHHEYYLTPQDLLDGISKVAAHYDQPFGNSSALPAYHCARLAKAEGVEKLLAGDGGDELFGGNTRYAKQKLFEVYYALPESIRRSLVEPLLLKVPGMSDAPIARKAASYVRQALTPMPDRMNSYNQLERLGVEQVLTPEFASVIDPHGPRAQERTTYASVSDPSLINKMLAYDWKYTLADNDLPKVMGTTELAGISVGFPLLRDELVDFSLRLPAELKVRGLRLRYFFKEALRGFLPDQIIRKKKHGFGLPFGIWLTQHPALRSFAGDSLKSLGGREIIRRSFLDELMNTRLAEHPAYYGEMIWILMMLECWLASRAGLTDAVTTPRLSMNV